MCICVAKSFYIVVYGFLCSYDNYFIGQIQGAKHGGAVYVRWGHDECPSTAELVYKGKAGVLIFLIVAVVATHSVYHLILIITKCQLVEQSADRFCMVQSIKPILTVTVMFMEDKNLMYRVQFVMSLNVLQSTCSLPSTPALMGGPKNTMGT